ncbi:MAG: IS66 family transposase, partial [Alphaproteobacteria bacterium]|nr:IS66 family transposase [Alphaproteobacteria bacterium]
MLGRKPAFFYLDLIMSTPLKPLSYADLLAENESLKSELAELRRLIYGQKRERFIPEDDAQFGLGFDAQEREAEETEEITYRRRKAKQPAPHSRKALPAHLPRKEILIEPEEDVSGLKKIGEEVTEELEYEPAQLYVNRYVRPKYAKANDEGVLIANLPSRPIEKGIAGPGLLSHILISKYVDHQPLYRQRRIILRSEIDIAESTLSGWVKGCCELLEPLYDAQWERIIAAEYLQVDETTIKVLDRSKKGKSHRGYFWVCYDPLAREAFFHYDPGRGGDVPRNMLENFSGFLQNDGFTGYDQFHQSPEITLVGCMAHARRKFKEALTNDKRRAEWMLERLQDLYAIERQARQEALSHRQRYQLRQQEALPIMDNIKKWLNQNYPQVKPKSKIGQAIGYILRQWVKLQTYMDNGRLEIDNNLVENIIRPVALGRKNYLFAGSHEGAKRAAIIYTLVTNSRMHDVEPFA